MPISEVCIEKLYYSYLATRSSHFNMNNMVNMDIEQAITKIIQVIQIGILSYRTAPINNSWLPKAVAPNHPPCISPWYLGGATLDTNEMPRGEIYNSATVSIK